MQQEPVLTPEATQEFDLVCLGHIHRPQQNGNVFYCGSPERLKFSDEKIQAGFWIHEIKLDLPYDNIESKYIETPARRFVTLEWDERDVGAFIGGYELECFNRFDEIKDAIIRVHYRCSEELAKQLDRKVLGKALYDAQAFYVAAIKADVQRVDRARDQEVTESLEPVEALGKWAGQREIAPEEITVLQGMTAVLIEEVAA
jgi:exonuclease SbcC/exonuclease SbcD